MDWLFYLAIAIVELRLAQEAASKNNFPELACYTIASMMHFGLWIGHLPH